jgi:GAF domain-containing protein
MVDNDALQHALREYTQGLLRSYDIGETLYWLTDQVPAVIDVDGAGVWLGNADTSLGLVTATDAQITRVESQQLSLDSGPCLDAFSQGERVVCNDLGTETRWPDYVQVARANGFGAVAGLPMPVDQQPIGSLNLYRKLVTPWLDEELEAAQLLADMATGYVLNVRNLDQSSTLTDQLTHALDSRVVIEQAKGLIAGRHGIEMDDAFDLLRTYARREHRSLHEVCRQVVDQSVDI